VAECDPDNRAVGRPHVAKALVAKGYFATVQEAFDVLLKRGRPGYEPQPKLSPEEAVELLHQAGGLAVLAHPSELEDKPLVNCLMKNVKFDGIEVYHPSADINEQKYWLELAQNFDLLVSGGSDFHGVSGRFPEQLGIFEVLYTNVKNVIEYKQ
jgi:predicted metal-dependent phosphoesterase TrpH